MEDSIPNLLSRTAGMQCSILRARELAREMEGSVSDLPGPDFGMKHSISNSPAR
jgi:hypothetical protein